MESKAVKRVQDHLKVDIKSVSEERANMVSHGMGLLLFLTGLPFLLYHASNSQNSDYFYGSLIYGISLLMVYTSSTLYHSSYNAKVRRRLRIFDHISIYFLIAGTYTPFILTHINTTMGWTMFVILWIMVVMGSFVKLMFVDRFKMISTTAYLVMGWLALLIIKPLYDHLPAASFYCIVAGGLMYTIGSYFYMKESLKYNHLIWHVFVVLGSLFHFVAVFLCL